MNGDGQLALSCVVRCIAACLRTASLDGRLGQASSDHLLLPLLFGFAGPGRSGDSHRWPGSGSIPQLAKARSADRAGQDPRLCSWLAILRGPGIAIGLGARQLGLLLLSVLEDTAEEQREERTAGSEAEHGTGHHREEASGSAGGIV